MKRSTVSIDLGASYTKVAYRRPFAERSAGRFGSQETELAVVEGTATIPSVMVLTGDRKQPWIAGRQAAGLTPGSGMKVFENWKSPLYSSAFDAKKVELVSVAGGFFRWLLSRLEEAGFSADVPCRVRVTIPALRRIEEQQEALIQCMRMNGWPDPIEVVVEPVANIVGVLSGGRNVVSGSGQISYWPTFGAAERGQQGELNYVFNEIRKYALGNRKKQPLRVSVVDFGSFTLDMASVELDLKVTEYDEFPANRESAWSWEIGVVEEIDQPCLTELFARHDINVKSLPFEVKESAKVALYAGEAYAPQKGRMTLGNSEADKAMVACAIDAFCQKAWAKVLDHWPDPEVFVLTGGGGCIPCVREFFCERLERKGVARVVRFDGQDGAMGAGVQRESKFVRWVDAADGLGRLATALGGASIGFGFEPDTACRAFLPRGSPL